MKILTSWGIFPTIICLALIGALAYVGDVDYRRDKVLREQAETIQKQAERIEELSTITMGNLTIRIEPKPEEEPKAY